MYNPVCAVCGHVNRVGAVACEACDARLDAPPEADGFGDAHEPFDSAREPFDTSYEPFDTSREPSWSSSGTHAGGGSWAPFDDIPAPPFKGAGDVISPMLAVYRKHFTLVGILVLVTTVPEALLQYGFLSAARATAEGGAVEVVSAPPMSIAIVSGLLFWVLAAAGAALLASSLTFAVVDVQRTGSASAGEALARGLKALPMVFVVSLIYTVVTGFGYLMLIVPGVIFSLMFAVCIPAAVVEGLGPVAALKRSAELTKGYRGLVFITFFLWGLLVAVLSWVVAWSFTNAGNLDLLPTLLLQTAILGMLGSSSHVLTVYIYLALLREHRSGFQTT